jgi:hypothetical protein
VCRGLRCSRVCSTCILKIVSAMSCCMPLTGNFIRDCNLMCTPSTYECVKTHTSRYIHQWKRHIAVSSGRSRTRRNKCNMINEEHTLCERVRGNSERSKTERNIMQYMIHKHQNTSILDAEKYARPPHLSCPGVVLDLRFRRGRIIALLRNKSGNRNASIPGSQTVLYSAFFTSKPCLTRKAAIWVTRGSYTGS